MKLPTSKNQHTDIALRQIFPTLLHRATFCTSPRERCRIKPFRRHLRAERIILCNELQVLLAAAVAIVIVLIAQVVVLVVVLVLFLLH